jgi:hypothetical protein
MYKVTLYVYNYSKNLDDAAKTKPKPINLYNDEIIIYYDTLQSARDVCANISYDRRFYCMYNGKNHYITVKKSPEPKIDIVNNKII